MSLPSNAPSSEMDLNFDTFFLMISSQGKQFAVKFFSLPLKKNYRDIQMQAFTLVNPSVCHSLAKWR
jgi:hypothetical protein